MAIDTIKSTAVLDGAIATADIADANITTAKIADDAVTGAKLANNIDVAGTLDVTGVLTADTNATVVGTLGVGQTSPITKLDASQDNIGGNVALGIFQSGNAYGNVASSASLYLGATYHSLANSAKITSTHSSGTTGNHAQDLTFNPINSGSTSFEAMRIQSGGGISFNGDTAAANALDDYEEGTFTVGWSSTNNSFNPSSTTAYYTKVGNLVTVTYQAYLAGAPTLGTAANGFSFTGLPFTSSSGRVSALTWGHKRWMEWPANTTDVFLQIPAGSTTIETLARTGVGEMYNIRAQAFSRNGSAICFTGHYYTDA